MLNSNDLVNLKSIVINHLRKFNSIELPDELFVEELQRIIDLENKLETMIQEMEKSNG